jgi:hypothetical protein
MNFGLWEMKQGAGTTYRMDCFSPDKGLKSIVN